MPRATADAGTRINDFVQLARTKLDTLISSSDWPLNAWNVVDSFVAKGHVRDTGKFYFYNTSARISRTGITGDALDHTFIDFAKAYIRYTHAAAPAHFECEKRRLKALKLIEAGFRYFSLSPKIQNCNPTILNAAVDLAIEGLGTNSHYQLAVYIEQVHRFCSSHKLYAAPFQWAHGVGKPKERRGELSEAAKKWRESMLPSPEAFSALAHVFRNPERFADQILSAVSAICCAVPIRAHEVLQLRKDCEVQETRTVERVAPDGTEVNEVGVAYGIRVWPGKGNAPQVKWVPSVMVSIVQEAIQRLRDLCHPARQQAAWYETNPGRLWLPPALEHLRQTEWLSVGDVHKILGFTNRYSMSGWLRAAGIEIRKRTEGGSRNNLAFYEVRFADAERAVISLLPRNFPWFNGDKAQPYSDTLIVIPYASMHTRRGPYLCMIEACNVPTFTRWLSGHGAYPNVFKRYGFKERDGSPIEITTHAFRHWLNTVAQLRGLSELDIAKWSGRRPEQNSAYNHVTPEEIVAQIRQLVDEGDGVGPLFEAARSIGPKAPISQEEFLKAQIGSAHVTDYGACIHDYSLLPCQNHGDCLGCAENIFVKGDSQHIEKIRKRLDLTKLQLRESQSAQIDGIFAADRWTQDHLRNIAHMEEMLACHLNESMRDGTVINLKAERQDTEVAMAIRDREARKICADISTIWRGDEMTDAAEPMRES